MVWGHMAMFSTCYNEKIYPHQVFISNIVIVTYLLILVSDI